MTIERIINGQKMEIELTLQELYDAHFEAEKLDDAEWIMDEYDDDEFEACYNRPPLTMDEAMEIAYDFETTVDGDDHINECRYDIMTECVAEYVEKWRKTHD